MITLFYGYPNSGCTLFNRILCQLPNTVVLSEVASTDHVIKTSPTARRVSIHRQAYEWYGITLKSQRFMPAILELEEICQKSGSHLIIREWTAIYYYYERFRNALSMPKQLHGLYILSRLPREKCRPFAFVRSAIDVAKTAFFGRRHTKLWNRSSHHLFAKEYRRYAQDIVSSGMPIYHYEALCRDPVATLKTFCREMDLPYSEKALKDFHKSDNVCGSPLSSPRRDDDITIQQSRKRSVTYTIETLLREQPDLKESDRLLGLSPYRESSFQFHRRYLKDMPLRLIRSMKKKR